MYFNNWRDGAFLLNKVYGNYNMDLDKLKILGIEYLSVAINDFRSVFKAINEIYNLAGQSSVGLSFEQPVDTLNILESIKMIDASIKFYNAGSGECFGNTGENDKFQPNSPYAVAKSTASPKL